MNIKLDDDVIGKIYCNLQITKKSLKEPYPDFLKKWKSGILKVELGKVKVTIEAYRRTYSDEENVYFEGAELKFE